MENEFKNKIKLLKSIKMSAEEKRKIFSAVVNSDPRPSPYFRFIPSPFFQLFHGKAVTGVLAMLIFVLSGSGIIFASEKSMPGSLLYSVKVRLAEPVRGALILSPVKKAEYEVRLSKKRVLEAKSLDARKKLDPETEVELYARFANHSDRYNKTVLQIEKKNRKEDLIAVENLDQEMSHSIKVLEEFAHRNDLPLEEGEKEPPISPLSGGKEMISPDKGREEGFEIKTEDKKEILRPEIPGFVPLRNR